MKFELGRVEFVGNFQRSKLHKFLQFQINLCLKNKHLVIPLMLHDRQDKEISRIQSWLSILQQVTQCSTQKLQIHVDESKMLQGIMHIDFIRLKELYLRHQRIDTLQPLLRLKAPNIIRFSIERNALTKIKTLRKFILTRLRYLCIENNPIQDVQFLEEIVMQDTLFSISLECTTAWVRNLKDFVYQNLKEQPCILFGENLNYLTKIYASQIEDLCTFLSNLVVFKRFRINGQWQEENIIKRFKKVKITTL